MSYEVSIIKEDAKRIEVTDKFRWTSKQEMKLDGV